MTTDITALSPGAAPAAGSPARPRTEAAAPSLRAGSRETPGAAAPAGGAGDRASPPFPERSVRLRIDEATQIVQTEVRDARTGRVVCELPADDWLRLAQKLREFAARAFVDKSV